eukprot:303888_1
MIMANKWVRVANYQQQLNNANYITVGLQFQIHTQITSSVIHITSAFYNTRFPLNISDLRTFLLLFWMINVVLADAELTSAPTPNCHYAKFKGVMSSSSILCIIMRYYGVDELCRSR